MIISLSVDGLFGKFNHQINFNDGQIVIIHGDNGIGKTTFLKLIDSIFNDKLFYLIKYRFKEIKVFLLNDRSISFTRKSEDGNLKITYKIVEGKKTTLGDIYTSLDLYNSAKMIESKLAYIDEVQKGIFVDLRNAERMDSYQLVEKFNAAVDISFLNRDLFLKKFLSSFRVKFITASRINKIRFSEKYSDFDIIQDAIDLCAKNLHELYKENLLKYAKKSQELDQTLARRMLSKKIEKMDVENILSNIVEVVQRQDQLRDIGVFESENLTFDIPNNLLDIMNNESKLFAMSNYVEDSFEKLSVLEDFSKKLKIFFKIINNKLKGKKLSVDKNDGLIVDVFNADGRVIEKHKLSELSSGEQHEVILMYELIFNKGENTLFLIDEPELSLHINWQKEFVSDLGDISIKFGSFAVISTHSPYIVNEHRDLMQTFKRGN